MSQVAEKYGQRPSDLLGIPAGTSTAWLRFCLDEAVAVKAIRHGAREDRRARERADTQESSGGLYAAHVGSGTLGTPPPPEHLRLLPRIEEEPGGGD